MTTGREKTAAFESLKKIGEMLPGIFEAFQQWAEFGSLQQAAEADAKQVASQAAAAKSSLGQARLEAEAERRRHSEKLNEERIETDRIVAAKQATAAKLLSDAGAEHDRVIAMAAKNVENQMARLERLKVQHADLMAEIAAEKKTLDDLKAAVVARRADLAKVNSAIAEVREKLGIKVG
jgi:uncharacterized coiled-coil protein SlyX